MHIKNLWKTVPSVSAMALATLYAGSASAQTEEPGEVNEGGLTEIVVTAQKRSEALSRTAAAVSVVGQQTLDSIGARSFEDAVTTIPNLSANGLGGTLAIRGLGTNSYGGGNSTVATHIDGIFYGGLEKGPAAMYDIARIEVLRGPQGTLYGRNATAGVVNIITNNANTDKVEAFGDVSYGSWNRLTVRGVVNVPISDAFAIRLTGGYDKGDSWIRYPNGDHVKGADIYNLRLAWRVKPTDRITWDARVSYVHDNSQSAMGVSAYKYDAVSGKYIKGSNPVDIVGLPTILANDGLATAGVPGPYSIYKGATVEQSTLRPSSRLSFRSNLNFELSDTLSLAYLLGYSREKSLPGIIGGLVGYQVRYHFTDVSSFWSHEINLNYQSDRLKAILGLYAYQTDGNRGDQQVYVLGDRLGPNNEIIYDKPLVEQDSGPSTSQSTARAIFGQATFDVTDRFRITGGARYNWDRSNAAASYESTCPFGTGLSGQQPNVATFPGFIPGLGGLPVCSTLALFNPSFKVFTPNDARRTRSNKFTWKTAIEYDLAPDVMLYATVATGYKAGAAGTESANSTGPIIRPETNINYEAGIRSRLFNNTLSLNLTAFWTDYKDQQITSTDPNDNTKLTLVNAGKTRTRGIEFEYAWAPTPADRINGYINYLDAKFIDFVTTDELVSGPARQFAGNRLAGAPEFSGRISYSHTFDLGSAGTLTPTASLYWQTKAYTSFTNSVAHEIPGYTRSDFILRYETANKRISLEGYINNIEDKILLQQVFPLQGVANSIFTPPRSYGVRLGFRY